MYDALSVIALIGLVIFVLVVILPDKHDLDGPF